jgi:hypothetical protein
MWQVHGQESGAAKAEITHKLWTEQSRGRQGPDASQAPHQLPQNVYSSAVLVHRAAGQAIGGGGSSSSSDGGRTQQQQQKYHPRGHKTHSYLPAWFPDKVDTTDTRVTSVKRVAARLDHHAHSLLPVQPARTQRVPQPPRDAWAGGVFGAGGGKGSGGGGNALVQKRLAVLGLMPGSSVSTSTCLAKGPGSGPEAGGKKRKGGGGGGVRMSLPAGLGLVAGPDEVGLRAESLPNRTPSAHASGALTERWNSSSVSPQIPAMPHHMPRGSAGGGGGVGGDGGETAVLVSSHAPKPPAAVDGVLRVPQRKARHRMLSAGKDPDTRLNSEAQLDLQNVNPSQLLAPAACEGDYEGVVQDRGGEPSEGLRKDLPSLAPTYGAWEEQVGGRVENLDPPEVEVNQSRPLAAPSSAHVPHASPSLKTARGGGEQGWKLEEEDGEWTVGGDGGGPGQVGIAGAEAAAEVEATEAELKLLRAQLRQLVDRSLFLPLSPCSRIPLTRLTAHPRMCYALALLPTRTTCITDCVGFLCSWRAGCSLRAGSSGMSLVQVKDRVAQLRARIAVVQSRAAAHGV